MITGLYAALFAFMQIYLTMQVVKHRREHQVSFGDGGHDGLTRHVRVHANFVETIPMALFLMLVLETGGLDYWVIHALGLSMLVSRIGHRIGLLSGHGHGKIRTYSMCLTAGVYLVAAILCLLMWVPIDLGLPIQYG